MQPAITVAKPLFQPMLLAVATNAPMRPAVTAGKPLLEPMPVAVATNAPMQPYWLSVTYNSIFGCQNKHFVRYSTMTWHISSNVSNTSGSYYSYCIKLLLQPLCHIFWRVKRVSIKQPLNSPYLVTRRDERATRQASRPVYWMRRVSWVLHWLASRLTRLVSPHLALWLSLVADRL